MPSELKSIDDVTDELLDRTIEVRSIRKGSTVKVKFRTHRHLYTLVVDDDGFNEVSKKINNKGLDIVVASNHVFKVE